MEVIGSRGKNWPIRDGKDHVKLIVSSAAAASSNGNSRPITNNGSGEPNEVVITSKHTEARKNNTRDPHTSLSLFSGQDEDYEASEKPTITAPRGSARPPPRDMKELFGDNDEAPKSPQKASSPKKGARPGSKDQSAKPPPRDYHDLFVGAEADASPKSKARIASPQKENAAIAPKAGAGKNFQPNRIFDNIAENPATSGANSPNKARKPDPTKFNHFEFGDEHVENSQQGLPTRPKTKHQSQWDFEDFSTPEKVPQKIRSQDVRHFGWGDDTGHESPAKHPNVPHPRPDTTSNFEFLDDGTPPGGKRAAGLPRGHAADRGAALYKNSLFNEDMNVSPEKKSAHPLSTVTNLKDRRKDFDPHYEISDQSPAGPHSQQPKQPIPETRAKAIKTMDAQWEATDQSPEPQQAKIYQGRAQGKENKGIKTGGDGMGGRKDTVRSWGFGSESDEDGKNGVNGGKFRPAKKQQAPKDDDFWND